ncbi:MAG: o-succinylbenzoate synthase, partial [Cyanobacteriota bacterium]
MASGRLTLAWRPFRFRLARPLHTARGALSQRRGWLLQLQEEREGRLGWGEVAPLELEGGQAEHRRCQGALAALGDSRERAELEVLLPSLPPALGFGLGAALAEL